MMSKPNSSARRSRSVARWKKWPWIFWQTQRERSRRAHAGGSSGKDTSHIAESEKRSRGNWFPRCGTEEARHIPEFDLGVWEQEWAVVESQIRATTRANDIAEGRRIASDGRLPLGHKSRFAAGHARTSAGQRILRRLDEGHTFAICVPVLTETLFGIGILPRPC